MFRSLLIFSAILMSSYQIFLFLSFDEQGLSQGVVSELPVMYEYRSSEELSALRNTFEDLQQASEGLYAKLSDDELGRKTLFFPDSVKKTLGK